MTSITDLPAPALNKLKKDLNRIEHQQPTKFVMVAGEFDKDFARQAFPELMRRDVENKVRAALSPNTPEEQVQKEIQKTFEEALNLMTNKK